MTKQETLSYLTAHGVAFELTEHAAVFNMAGLDSISLPYPDRDAKNLFVRDDKRCNYYLITVKGDKRVDLKQFRKAHGLRPLTFASAEELLDKLQLAPGAVTPLGLLHDEANCVRLYLDSSFCGGLVGVHPNDNTATVWLAAEDLVRLLREHGTDVQLVAVEA